MTNESPKAAKAPNYTEAMVERLLEVYATFGNAGLETIAEELGKTKRSVISKLVREGVYVAPQKAAAQPKDEGPSKKEMLIELESLSFSVEGLEGATKAAIARLIEYVKESQEA